MDLLPASNLEESNFTDSHYKPIWLFTDIEMTGLNIHDRNFVILEIAMIITDIQLNIKDSLHIVVHHPRHVLEMSSPFCKKTFCGRLRGGNDLFSYCEQSTVSQEEAGRQVEAFIIKHIKHNIQLHTGSTEITDKELGGRNKCLLAGCSVYFDLNTLLHVFPYLRRFISHQVVDVTSILHLVKRFSPQEICNIPELVHHDAHRAQVDIIATIRLLKWFKNTFFLRPYIV